MFVNHLVDAVLKQNDELVSQLNAMKSENAELDAEVVDLRKQQESVRLMLTKYGAGS